MQQPTRTMFTPRPTAAASAISTAAPAGGLHSGPVSAANLPFTASVASFTGPVAPAPSFTMPTGLPVCHQQEALPLAQLTPSSTVLHAGASPIATAATSPVAVSADTNGDGHPIRTRAGRVATSLRDACALARAAAASSPSRSASVVVNPLTESETCEMRLVAYSPLDDGRDTVRVECLLTHAPQSLQKYESVVFFVNWKLVRSDLVNAAKPACSSFLLTYSHAFRQFKVEHPGSDLLLSHDPRLPRMAMLCNKKTFFGFVISCTAETNKGRRFRVEAEAALFHTVLVFYTECFFALGTWVHSFDVSHNAAVSDFARDTDPTSSPAGRRWSRSEQPPWRLMPVDGARFAALLSSGTQLCSGFARFLKYVTAMSEDDEGKNQGMARPQDPAARDISPPEPHHRRAR
jgi:hypothetical protein